MRHATIIGAGIIGTSTAAFLQREGFSVTVVDRLPPGEGCSFGNSGGVAFAEIMPTINAGIYRKLPGWLMDPLGPLTIRWSYLPKALPWFLAAAHNTLPSRYAEIISKRAFLGRRVVADFETLLKDAGHHDLLVYREALRIYDSRALFDAEAKERDVKTAHGYAVETYSGDEARELEPDLGPGVTNAATHGGWYFVTNPGKVVKSIAANVTRNGGTFLLDDVKQIVVRDGKAEELRLASGKSLPLDRLVICAGAYSHLLSRQVGDHVLLEAERGYHIVLPDPGVRLSRSITYARSPGAATPMEMGLRIAGSDEFAGLEAAPNWRRADALYHNFKRILPGLSPMDEKATRWMGRRPGTPDTLPVIGASAKVPNVFYGFGHGHMGLTWGPSTGRMLAEIMAGKPGNEDMSAFRVNRF